VGGLAAASILLMIAAAVMKEYPQSRLAESEIYSSSPMRWSRTARGESVALLRATPIRLRFAGDNQEKDNDYFPP
jgi:hypothetical protein